MRAAGRGTITSVSSIPEQDAWLAEVHRFLSRTVDPAVARPEAPIGPVALAALLAEAESLGLCGSDEEPTGLAPWEGLGGGGPGATLAVLTRVSRSSTALALVVHQRALARSVARRASLVGLVGGPLVIAPEASHGLGRSALAGALLDAPLDDEDRALLADAFAENAARVLPLDPGFSGLLTPCLARDGALTWQLHAREQLRVTTHAPAHGLDELVTVELRPREPGKMATVPADVARTLVGETLLAHQLALVALSLGAVQRAYDQARRFASERHQGGKVIDRHAAVLGLLGRARATICGVGAQLDALSGQVLTLAEGPLALGLRARAQPELAAAANAAMQVFGGLGYLRDTGLEKVVRDVNCLRALAGSPRELELIVGEWDRLRGRAGHARLAPSPTASRCELIVDSLPGHVPPSSPLSPRTAFARLPRVARAMAEYALADPWELDTASLPPSLGRVRRKARAFAERHLAPVALTIDARGHGPPGAPGPEAMGVLRAAAREGLLDDLLPRPFGSADPRLFRHPLHFASALKVEELAAVDGGLMLLVSAHSLGVAPLLLAGDLGALRRFVLPLFRSCARGEPKICAFAITEPMAGSDVEEGHGAMRLRPGTIATRARGGWRLSGRKCFISGGDLAEGVVVFAALAGEDMPSWTAFWVAARTPGFRVVRTELKMGMRASGAAELELDEVWVPDDHVIGGLRNGWGLSRAVLNMSRIPVAAMGVGFARAATEAAIDFCCRVELGRRPLIAYQDVQLEIADMLADTSAARALVWAAARRPQALQREASAAKFRCTDIALAVCTRAMDLLGNHAPLHHERVEKIYRDARLTQIFEGTNQINRLAVVEDMQERLLLTIAARSEERTP